MGLAADRSQPGLRKSSMGSYSWRSNWNDLNLIYRSSDGKTWGVVRASAIVASQSI